MAEQDPRLQMTRTAHAASTGNQRWRLDRLLPVLAVVVLLLLYALGTFDRWRSSTPAVRQSIETPALAGFAQGPVQVYFTRTHYPEGPDNRAGGLDQTIAAEVDRAT